MSENEIVTYPDAEPADGAAAPDEAVNDDDLTALLAKRQHAKPNRLTWGLLTILVLVIGFIGGAFANQKFGATSGSSNAGSFRAAFAGGFPAGGFPAGGFPGSGQTGTGSSTTGAAALGNVTLGTVKLVDGTNLYLTTTTGETVKVKVPGTAKVTSQQTVALTDLPSGATVIVRGDKADDGTVTASSVSEGALPGAPTSNTANPANPVPSAQPTTQGAN